MLKRLAVALALLLSAAACGNDGRIGPYEPTEFPDVSAVNIYWSTNRFGSWSAQEARLKVGDEVFLYVVGIREGFIGLDVTVDADYAFTPGMPFASQTRWTFCDFNGDVRCLQLQATGEGTGSVTVRYRGFSDSLALTVTR